MKLILFTLLFTVNAFAGFTAFPPVSPPADSITTKGGLLTSDGSTQAEVPACADDEIIVFDSAETYGFKCEAKPSGGGGSGPTIETSHNSGTAYDAAAQQVEVAMPNLDISFTTNSTTNPVSISIGGDIQVRGDHGSGVNSILIGCSILVFRNAVEIAEQLCWFQGASDNNGVASVYCSGQQFMDHTIAASTTYAYTFKIKSIISNSYTESRVCRLRNPNVTMMQGI